MREMLLLGAGASATAGVPTSFQMASKIFDSVSHKRHRNVLSLAMGGLLFRESSRGIDPTKTGVDVEALFRTVQLLATRHSLEIFPFVGSWHYLIEELDRLPAESKRVAQGLRLMIESGGRPFSSHMAVQDLSDFIDRHLPGSGGGDVFRSTNEEMIRVLRQIVWIRDYTNVAYLRPILRLLNHQDDVVIATLNYDNSIEMVAEGTEIGCETGIEQWSATGHFATASTGLTLLKLHGSIEWALAPGRPTPEQPLPHSVVSRRTPAQMRYADELRKELNDESTPFNRHDEILEELRNDVYWPALIFGNGNKLTAEGPYLDLLQAFRRELSRADLLTVIGYSFRDPHVNEYITQWINADSSREMRIVNGVDYAIKATGYGERLLNSLGERVEVVPDQAAEALPELWP